MIKNIIFDLGDVFIDLDYSVLNTELKQLSKSKNGEYVKLGKQFEVGAISKLQFLTFFTGQYPNKSKQDLIDLWNTMIAKFPLYRLEFLERISSDYNTILLSNTNPIHIDYFKNLVGNDIYQRFVNCFDKVYYSHEIKMRKPNVEIFRFVLLKNNWAAEETLFVDDNVDNINAASQLGLKTWRLKVGEEEVTDLFQKKII